MLPPLSEPAGSCSLWMTPLGLGMSGTGHAGRAQRGCRDTARWCISLVLRALVPAKPGSACEPTKSAGSRKPEEPLCKLWLAPPAGTCSRHGAEEKGAAGWAGRAQSPWAGQHPKRWLGQEGITPQGSKSDHLHGGGAGVWGQAEERGSAGSVHAAPLEVLGNGGP